MSTPERAKRWAFSTLGAPGRPLHEHLARALRHGCTGLELRVHQDEFVHLDLPVGERRSIRARIADADLAVPCLAGYAGICAPTPDPVVLSMISKLLDLAHDLGAPAVRIFPGGTGEGDAERAGHRLAVLLPEATARGVTMLVETHDSHPTGAAVASLVRPFAGAVGVIWDALHPWRHGEQPADTADALTGLLRYVQIKDAASAADTTPVPLGTGSVPLTAIGTTLREHDWRGWVSLEWERAWYPDVAPLDDVLPAAAEWVNRFGSPTG
ncbi:sugar phosphate isomerase/epimerase family protein [Embleya scabrispora]|uniref:sugar phosphate isomerase/epimerase family protein n=1 Tax=Embleya scabrispora TaxID=159449 RepID=UPI00037C0CB5|nr:sugar phosphate isomerase/epimerase family protein [Embleya scabrispora]MYS82563.1 TIM barrel protein [Streptomyces sp. SID5474]